MHGTKFPISKSFLCSEALAKVLEEAYGLSRVRCQLMQATMRDVYHVRSQHQCFVLFIYHSNRSHSNRRSAAEITAEWDFVDYLHSGGAAVAPAIRQSDGNLLLTLDAPEGVRHAVLSTFVEGKHLRLRHSIEAVRCYGREIAQIHALADTMPRIPARLCNEFDIIVAQSIAAFETVYPDHRADIADLHHAATIIQSKMNLLSRERPYYGMVHGDVIRANAQVSGSGRVTVLDFDLCGWGWRAYDVASYLQVIEGSPEEEAARHAFLDGYQELRQLTQEEVASLPLFIAARHILSIGVPTMNAYHWGNSYLSDGCIRSALDGVRRNLQKIV